jgi:glycosyltransferase involved in cell wall biosynthesis
MMKSFIFVFGHEPWFLPPALEMLEVLKMNGFETHLIYAQSIEDILLGDDLPLADSIKKIKPASRFPTLFLANELKRCVQELIKPDKEYIVLACDIIALQAIRKISSKNVRKGFWAFEIIEKPFKITFSFDYFRKHRYPNWIKECDFYFAPSNSRLKRIERRVNKDMPREVLFNCKMINNKGAFQLKTQKTQKEIRLVYTGRVSEVQYISDILGCLVHLPSNVVLFIAGFAEKYIFEELEAKAKKLAIADRVFLLGQLTRQKSYELLSQCDIGLVFYNPMMSIDCADPAPNKIGDYVAANLWMIGTDQPYIKKWLEEKKLGIVLRNVTPKIIADSVKTLIDGPNFSDRSRQVEVFGDCLNMNQQADKLLSLVN